MDFEDIVGPKSRDAGGGFRADPLVKGFQSDYQTRDRDMLRLRRLEDTTGIEGGGLIPTSAVVQGSSAAPQRDFDNSYNTILSPAEESRFTVWKRRYAPKDSGEDYDLRGAFKADLWPDSKTGHWPDTFKKPNHETFSDESRYAPYGQPGRWEGETFIPPKSAKPLDFDSIRPLVAVAGKTNLDFEDIKGEPSADSSWTSTLNKISAFNPFSLGNVAATADMFLSLPGQLIGLGADIGARVRAAGEDRRTGTLAGEGGRQLTESIMNPLQKLMKATGTGDVYDQSSVSMALSKLGEWLSKGGESVEKKSGGLLLKEDVDSLINGAFALGGVAGVRGLQRAGRSRADLARSGEWMPPEQPKVNGRQITDQRPTGPIEKDITPAAESPSGESTANLPALPDWAKGLGIGAGAYAAAQLTGQDAQDALILGAAAMAMKKAGGNWHPKAGEVIAGPLFSSMQQTVRQAQALRQAGDVRPLIELKTELEAPLKAWTTKASQTYLNRHMGTESDPLKDIEIPFGEGTKKWGEVTDAIVSFRPAREYLFQGVENIPPFEPVYDLNDPLRVSESGSAGQERIKASAALRGYLSHVGDYLRENVAAEKLPQYDLVRAVKETAKKDEAMARQMEKAAAADMKDLPVYKDYGDGMKWVELKLPERLTEGQLGAVKPRNMLEAAEGGQKAWLGPNRSEHQHFAVDSQGKPVTNTYTGDLAGGATPEEAYLAGQLAREGNQMGHCVGGYCEGVASGESKIFSLRDAKGKSHVTIEVQPRASEEVIVNYLDRTAPEERASYGPVDTDNILQIKGKQNRAPQSTYLPYVQDFVKSGKWGEVGDLEGTGLHKAGDHYHTEADFRDLALQFAERMQKDDLQTKGFVHGATKELLERIPIEPPRHLEIYVEAAEKAGLKPRGSEAGSADPALLARLAAAGAGAALGAYLNQENPLWGALAGGMGALIAARISPKGVVAAVKRAMQPEKLVKIDNLAREVQYDVKAARRASWQVTERVLELVPKLADRVAVRRFLEGDKTITLSKAQEKAAGILREAWNQRGLEGLSASVLKDLQHNYVTHVWGNKTGETVWDKIFGRGGSGTSENTPFSMRRVYATIEEGKAKGLVPLTEDPILLFEIYANSLARAIANKKFIGALKESTADGKGLVVPLARSPGGYERIDHPQMQGLAVHPDIAPMMRFIFDENNPGVIVKGMEAVSTIQKRLAVSASLFHAKALEDAALAAHRLMTAPGFVVKTAAQAALPSIFGRDTFLKQLRTGGPGDLVDRGIKAGLQFSLERQGAALEELNSGFYQMLQGAGKFLDETIPHLGAPIRGIEKMNQAMDSFMWGRLHAALKLNTFAEKSAQLAMNDAKAAAKAGRPAKPQEELDRIAASFANDMYGGLNWQELILSLQSRFGRELGQAVLGPSGRRAMRIGLFAPDWTISTTRAFVKAFGPGAGIKGLIAPQKLADLHRQYLLRGAFWYSLAALAMNQYFSGHPFWENKDPTRIDLGDGRTMQWSKHFMEPFHWILNPAQQGLNKLGVIPKEILNQTLGTEYLNPRKDKSGSIAAGPAMKGSRLGHLARQFAPISGQQYAEGDLTSAVSGFLGAPIYGKTTAERENIKAERKMKMRQERLMKRLEKR